MWLPKAQCAKSIRITSWYTVCSTSLTKERSKEYLHIITMASPRHAHATSFQKSWLSPTVQQGAHQKLQHTLSTDSGTSSQPTENAVSPPYELCKDIDV